MSVRLWLPYDEEDDHIQMRGLAGQFPKKMINSPFSFTVLFLSYVCDAENQILYTGKCSTPAFKPCPYFIFDTMEYPLAPAPSFNTKRKMGAALLICKDNGYASSETILSCKSMEQG